MIGTQMVRVAHKAVEAPDVCSFDLVAADGGDLLAFDAGAHVDVHLRVGLVRQYSLCNDPREASRRYRLAVRREAMSRGGSIGMHALEEGQLLTISAPRNHFPLAAGARRHLLLAGGIGITPLLAMALQLEVQGATFELHYCTRSSGNAAFAQQLRDSSFAARAHLHLTDGTAAQRFDPAPIVATHTAGDHLYVCGPAGFMEAVLTAARKAGWPEDALHREFFDAGTAGDVENVEFDVRIASTGALIRISPKQNVVEALAAAGVEVPVFCEQGVCGTCMTRVLEGMPDHRDVYLTDQERARGDCFLPCCSRAKSPVLLLDL